jgi:ADP-dependent NAD(P)H-hydrate dehydratase / NAD(P)H-hydrate epimerase
MQAWDDRAIQSSGIPQRVLMENAGRAVAHFVDEHYPTGCIVAAVGKGNNGGDALVALRTLRAWGREVLAVGPGAAEPRGDLLHGWEVRRETDAEGALRGASAVLDGLLGTGARGAPRGEVADLIRLIEGSGVPVVALDIPSGVDATTGAIEGVALTASATITFGAPKYGQLRFPGRGRCGRLVVVEIGFPPLVDDEYGAALVTDGWAASRLPSIQPDAHKGTQGRLLVVGGREGMSGAAILAATGALRAGAGLVIVLSDAASRVPVQAAVPEAIFRELDPARVRGEADAARAVLVGPGLGTDDAARDLLRELLHVGDSPVLLDADALNLLAAEPRLGAPLRTRPALLTPHPAEMGRLLSATVEEIVADPFAAAAAAADRFGCAVLLKGTPSLVSTSGAATLVSTAGHSGVATGGMGDTLAGIAGAFLAAGVAPREAAALALHYAGRAAERAGRGRSLLPRDVAEHLGGVLQEGGSGHPPPVAGVLLDLPPAR